MDYYFTYQQTDTITVNRLKDLSSKVNLPVGLDVKRTIIPAENLRIDTSIRRETVISPPPQQQASTQNRAVRNRAEEKALVNSSNFIQPQTEVLLTLKPVIDVNDFVLPVRRLNRTNYDWITIVLLLCLIIFASLRNPFANYIANLFKSTVNYPTSARMFRERSYSIMDGAFRLDIYFYFIFSLFIYQSLIYMNIEMPVENFNLFLFCILAVLSYFVLKRLLYILVGFVNKGQAETIEYLFNLNNYNRILGIFLFPVVAIIAFSPILKSEFFVYLGLFLVIISYGMSLQRGILILLKKQFSIVYLFLYLCTLEILPLLLIFKIVLV